MNKARFDKWIIDQLEDSKALDIISLDVRGHTSLTDFMVICTGTSNRHVKAIADKLCIKAKELRQQIIGVEGEQDSQWILVDLGDAIVHVMQQQTRDFYQLEKLWQETETK